MSSTPVLTSDRATASGASATPWRHSTRRVVRRPHVLPYIATVPARAQRTPANWKGTMLVGAMLAVIVVTALAAAVAR